MKLSITVDGVERSVDLTAGDTAGIVTIAPGLYSVLLNGRSYEVRVEGKQDALAVFVNGRRFAVEVTDPRAWSSKATMARGEGVQTIAAPMPGKVVRILVAAGDHVEAGQGLLVVEAMKMQNELKAPRAGTVRSVSVVEGATVAAGELLATLS